MNWSLFALLVVIAVLGSALSKAHGILQQPIRIGAWNLQRLGTKKMTNPAVVTEIVKVMRRFDIIVILEVTDSHERASWDLLESLNSGLPDTYNLTISERLGRARYKEQYAFYWKPSVVTVNSTMQYDDSIHDYFQFEPFIVVFEGKFDETLTRFGLMPIHIKPSNAVKELDALVNVYDTFTQMTGIDDVVITGDLNAGCTYLDSDDHQSIRLFTDPRFTWLIGDSVDTTTKDTLCPYDRIILAGNNMLKATYKNTAQPFYFDKTFNLTDRELIEDISDHYPVEVLLRGYKNIHTNKIHSGTAISVAVSVTPDELMNFSTPKMLDFLALNWVAPNATAAISYLKDFSASNPKILNQEALEVLLYKYSNGGLTDSALYGEDYTPGNHTINIHCNSQVQLCTTTWTVTTPIN